MRHEKHDKAVLILRDCERRGLPVHNAVDFLLSKGMELDQIIEALNEASNGALVDAAVGAYNHTLKLK